MTENPSARYMRSSFFMRHVVNPLTTALGGPTIVVRGRRSGRPVRTVVPPFVDGGVRYLVAGGGETHWVRNLRAAGAGELRRGRTHEPFHAVELRGDERARVVAPTAGAWVVGPVRSSPRCPMRPTIPSSASSHEPSLRSPPSALPARMPSCSCWTSSPTHAGNDGGRVALIR